MICVSLAISAAPCQRSTQFFLQMPQILLQIQSDAAHTSCSGNLSAKLWSLCCITDRQTAGTSLTGLQVLVPQIFGVLLDTNFFYLVIPCKDGKQLCHMLHHKWRIEIVPHSCTQCAPPSLLHTQVLFYMHMRLGLHLTAESFYTPFPSGPLVNLMSS